LRDRTGQQDDAHGGRRRDGRYRRRWRRPRRRRRDGGRRGRRRGPGVRHQDGGHVLDNIVRGAGQRPGGDQRGAAPEAPHTHQLLRRVAGVRRLLGGAVRHVVQRQRRDHRQVDVRVRHVRRLEQPGRVLFHRVHTAPVLHQRGPVLRHRQPAAVPDHHDAAYRSLHAAQRVDATGAHIVPPDILRLVHDRRAPGVPPQEPHVVRFRRQPVLRDHIVVRLVLDTRRRHDRHVLQVLARDYGYFRCSCRANRTLGIGGTKTTVVARMTSETGSRGRMVERWRGNLGIFRNGKFR